MFFMENETLYSFFEKARTENPVCDDNLTVVFRLPHGFAPESLGPLAVKYDLFVLRRAAKGKAVEEALLETTSLTPVAHGLTRSMGQTFLSSDNGVEVKSFIEGISLDEILQEKKREFEKKFPQNKTKDDPFDRAESLAFRYVAHILANLPDEHYILLMRDVKDFNDRGYCADPADTNILLTENGLRLIDFMELSEDYGRSLNCAKELKNAFFRAITPYQDSDEWLDYGDNNLNSDQEFEGWKKTIAEKLHSAAEKCGVGINKPEKPDPQKLAMMKNSTAHEGVHITMRDAPHVLQYALEEMARSTPSTTHRAPD
jgi:hypothetical protein